MSLYLFIYFASFSHFGILFNFMWFFFISSLHFLIVRYYLVLWSSQMVEVSIVKGLRIVFTIMIFSMIITKYQCYLQSIIAFPLVCSLLNFMKHWVSKRYDHFDIFSPKSHKTLSLWIDFANWGLYWIDYFINKYIWKL